MAKWTAVGFGAENAEVDPETIDSFYDEAELGVPPKGIYRGVAKRLKTGVTSESAANPGEPKMVMVCEIAEPKGTKKARYNGYGMWLHRPVNKESANRVNQVLTALLDGTKLTAAKRKAVIRAFWTGNVQVDDQDFITKIGTWVVPEEIEVAFTTRSDKYNGETRLAIGNLLPISDAPKPKPSDSDEDEDDEEVDEEEVDDEEEEDEDEDEESEEDDEEEDEDEEPESSEEEDARYDELMALTRAQLVKLYKETIEGAKVLKSTKSEDMANAIVDAEFAESDDEEEEDEEEPEEDEEEEEPEEDEEEEEEPPAKSTRRRAAPAAKTRKVATPAPSGRGKARAGSSKAPAARRRSGKGDEPPF